RRGLQALPYPERARMRELADHTAARATARAAGRLGHKARPSPRPCLMTALTVTGAVQRHQGLQALRGIAALLVVAHHVHWPVSTLVELPDPLGRLNLGSLGVFSFFALSG